MEVKATENRENHIRELNFHALRHTFATRSLETKMDLKTLSELLGHESEAVTIKIYCHSFMSTKKRLLTNSINTILLHRIRYST